MLGSSLNAPEGYVTSTVLKIPPTPTPFTSSGRGRRVAVLILEKF
jgi:hypothetical protein